ncbi:metal ABC transporter solute-binding protein, Zn/Mn family [Vibrio europaeus]|uniref:metal ABC transporter solute-binding protein, Zn/Mn family n=1 Tax=Vibrio europaeus TaxID=300876 RepID=UPI00148D2507|nr:zinc ABC transporter substrate-binding protein [Vibrio europaeus]NOH22404.1 ABC transporter substrate-binding protein [Vibrio europaeus]
MLKKLTLALLAGFLCHPFASAQDKLTVGITMHPYYSYVKTVVENKMNVLPLVDASVNSHNYLPQPNDLVKLKTMDAIVVNGIGHDEFAMEVIKAANRRDLTVIYANQDIPLLPAMGQSVGSHAVNPHTFIGLATTIQKVYTIAHELGKLDPSNESFYRTNARNYAKQFRRMKHNAMQQLLDTETSKIKVATTHNAYGYLLQEFGVEVAAVIEPAHGVEPSASQLQQTIEKIKGSGIDVLFYELDMPNRFVDTIEKETGVALYRFSHMTHGEYTQEKVIVETQHNLDALVDAIKFAANKVS